MSSFSLQKNLFFFFICAYTGILHVYLGIHFPHKFSPTQMQRVFQNFSQFISKSKASLVGKQTRVLCRIYFNHHITGVTIAPRTRNGLRAHSQGFETHLCEFVPNKLRFQRPRNLIISSRVLVHRIATNPLLGFQRGESFLDIQDGSFDGYGSAETLHISP